MKYCSKCGRQLMDGEICNCTQQADAGIQQNVNYNGYDQQQYANYNGYDQQNVNYNGYAQQQNVLGNMQNMMKQNATGAVQQILELLKSPVRQGKNFVFAGNIAAALILIVLQAIASGLFAVVMSTKAQGLFDKIIGLFSSSSSASEIVQMKSMLKIPVFKAFILTLILSIVLTFILAAFIMMFNAILHNQMMFANTISLISLRSMVATIIVLLGCIVSFINLYAGITVFALGNIAGFMLIAVVWSHCCQETADKQIYMMIITYVIFMVVYVLVVRMCWKMYLPDMLKVALDQMGTQLKSMGGTNAILKEIVGSLY